MRNSHRVVPTGTRRVELARLPVLLLVLLLAPAISAEKPLTIPMLNLTNPPYIWYDSCNKQGLGAAREILLHIFGKLGISDEQRYVKSIDEYWKVVSAPQKFGFDGALAPAVFVGDNLASAVPVFVPRWSVFYLREKLGTVTDPAQLAGKKGLLVSAVMNKDDVRLERLSYWKLLDISDNDDAFSAFNLLMNGQVSYIISDHYIGRTYLLKEHLIGEISALPLADKVGSSFYFVLDKSSPYADIMPAFNRELTTMRESGQFSMIFYRNMQNFIDKPECH